MTLVVIGILAAWGLIYAGSCWWRPLAHCWCCEGGGRHYRKDGKVFRECRWCRGTGRRWRLGRRVWNYFRKRAHT